jgi:hypothetical protein
VLGVLSVLLRVACRAAIAETEIEIAIWTKSNCAAIMIWKWLFDDQHHLFAVRVGGVSAGGKARDAGSPPSPV